MAFIDKYTKPPECVDIIHRTSQGFHIRTRASRATSWENRVMYFRLYQHTRVVLYLLYTQAKISFNYCKTA